MLMLREHTLAVGIELSAKTRMVCFWMLLGVGKRERIKAT